MPVRIPSPIIRTPGLPGFYPDKHKYCHTKGALLKTNCFVSAPVVFDSSDGSLLMPSAVLSATQVILGVCAKNHWNILQVDAATERYYVRSGDAPYIMSEGEMTFKAEKPITKMYGQVYFRHTADDPNNELYTVSDTAGDGLLALGNCRFVELSAAPGIVWVEVRI